MTANVRRKRGRVVALTAAVAVLSAGATAVVLTGGEERQQQSTAANSARVGMAPVKRTTLAARTVLQGTFGYAGDYTVAGNGRGTLTWAPKAGDVVAEGQPLYQVDGAPVVLLHGNVPAYRALGEGDEGTDVRQLNAALVRLGFAGKALADSAKFTSATKLGVEKLQKSLGVERTGRLDLGAVAFLPTDARITKVATAVGGQVQQGAPLLSATSTAHTVHIDLAASQQTQVKVGDKVDVAFPDGTTAAGTVTQVSAVATDTRPDPGPQGKPKEATIPVTVTLADATAGKGLDQAPVQVSITTATADDVLVVPVTALLALAGGGYALEVVESNGARKLVGVTIGLLDDEQGLTEVSGSGLEAGQNVLVPSS